MRASAFCREAKTAFTFVSVSMSPVLKRGLNCCSLLTVCSLLRASTFFEEEAFAEGIAVFPVKLVEVELRTWRVLHANVLPQCKPRLCVVDLSGDDANKLDAKRLSSI